MLTKKRKTKTRHEKLGIRKRNAMDLKILSELNRLAGRRLFGIESWLRSDLKPEEKLYRIIPLIMDIHGAHSMFQSLELYGVKKLLENMESLVNENKQPKIIFRDLPILKEAVVWSH